MPQAIVLQPPPGNLTGPCAGPAYLKSYAQDHGFDVWAWDVGIDAFRYLIEPRQVGQLVERADLLRRQLEEKRVLKPFELRWYSLLLMAKGFGLDPGRIRAAVAGFGDAGRFYDYARYKIDCKVLDAFFRLLRAVCYPTMVTPWDYPSAHALKTADAIRLHLDEGLNPYVAYYRKILIPRIAQARPQIVGISMVYASQSVQALVLGLLLKEQLPGIHITMGGSYLTQWALLMEEAQLSMLFNAADSVVLGEGEIPFVHLLEWCNQETALSDVPNLIFRKEGTGQIERSEALVFTDLTQQPPPDYSDHDLGAYLTPEPVLPYLLTRGCTWQRCGFCQNRVGGYRPRPYQSVPPEKAVAELSALSTEHGCRHFLFCGDVVDADCLKRFSQCLLEAKTPLFWHTNLRAEKEFSPDVCARLAEAGLTSVAIGMESGCGQTLENMDKGLDISTVGQTLAHLYDAGVATQVTAIFGFPGESEAQAQMTVDFLMNHVDCISAFEVGLLLVLPGSRMHNDPKRFGVNAISYEQTLLMTPEPLWKAAGRISLAAVNRLFEQLGGLEAASYLNNDHPYAGALCANHSLLYFTQGPYILRRLRALENFEHQEVHRIFGMDRHHRPVAQMQPKVPRLRFAHAIYRCPYPHERAHFATTVSKYQRPLAAGPGWDYLLDPINVPQAVSPQIQQMLARIDGRRDLQAVLEPEGRVAEKEELFFLIRLVLTGLVVLSDKAGSTEKADTSQ
jgi:anaerobic magnesium-protoporphyrin IX monomethyl ester cyclase